MLNIDDRYGPSRVNNKELFSKERMDAVRDRANRVAGTDSDFLVRIAAGILGERLDAINREFPVAIDLFSPFDGMVGELARSGKAGKIIKGSEKSSPAPSVEERDFLQEVVCNAENLPFNRHSANLITNLFTLHRSNQLPAVLTSLRHILQPDGLFLAVLPGDRTLIELRQSLIAAESELTGTAALRVDPFADVRQYGALLQHAGFALPVVDREDFVLRYSRLKDLVTDLRSMGATSGFREAAPFPNRKLFERTEAILKQDHADSDGKFRITVEMVFLSGWAPDENQQKPLKPGSADHKLRDFL